MRAAPLLLLLVVALAACGGEETGSQPTSTAPAAGTGADAGGGPLAEYRGEPFVANVWASW